MFAVQFFKTTKTLRKKGRGGGDFAGRHNPRCYPRAEFHRRRIFDPGEQKTAMLILYWSSRSKRTCSAFLECRLINPGLYEFESCYQLWGFFCCFSCFFFAIFSCLLFFCFWLLFLSFLPPLSPIVYILSCYQASSPLRALQRKLWFFVSSLPFRPTIHRR